jgi:hypothetical protein
MAPLDASPTPDTTTNSIEPTALPKRRPDPNKVWDGETELRNARHIVLPARIADDDRLTLIHLRVMHYVGRQNPDRGWVEMSQTKFADRWGYNSNSANNAIRQLVDWGYLEKLSQKDAHSRWCCYKVITGHGATCHAADGTSSATFHVADGASDTADAATLHVGDVASTATFHFGDGPTLHVGDGTSQAPLSIEESERSERDESENTDPHSAALRPSAGASDQEMQPSFDLTTTDSQEPARPKRAKPRPKTPQPTAEQFERFWDAYPRRKDKAKALKFFTRLSPDDAERAVTAAAQLAQEFARSGKDLTYCKYPATWLNDRSFEDYGSAQEAQPDRPPDYWWRDRPHLVPGLKPVAWRKAVAKYANGIWSVPTLGPGPWDPGCLVPQEVIDELGLRVKYPDPSQGGIKPNWWYGKEQQVPRYKPEFWEALIVRYASDAAWPVEYLGYGPWDDRCLVNPKVIAKLGLRQKYPKSDGKRACTESASAEQFGRFWAEYPRQEGKTAARQAFMCLSAEDAEKAITAATRFAEQCKRQKRETTKIKLPEGWLSTRGFDDFDDPVGDARRARREAQRAAYDAELEASRLDNL